MLELTSIASFFPDVCVCLLSVPGLPNCGMSLATCIMLFWLPLTSCVLRGWIEDGGEAGFKTSYHTVLWDCTAERVAFTLNNMLRLSVGLLNPFYRKENSQYLSRLGGTAGKGVLNIQYLFGPEWNTSLSRILGFFLSLFSALKHFKELPRKCQDFAFLAVLYEVTLQPLPGCQETEPYYPNHDTYFLSCLNEFSVFNIGPWSRTALQKWDSFGNKCV